MLSIKDVKQCPFCKTTENRFFRIVNMEPHWYQVHCQACGAKGPVGETFDESISLWNGRNEEYIS